jgi:hypothetical protein
VRSIWNSGVRSFTPSRPRGVAVGDGRLDVLDRAAKVHAVYVAQHVDQMPRGEVLPREARAQVEGQEARLEADGLAFGEAQALEYPQPRAGAHVQHRRDVLGGGNPPAQQHAGRPDRAPGPRRGSGCTSRPRRFRAWSG